MAVLFRLQQMQVGGRVRQPRHRHNEAAAVALPHQKMYRVWGGHTPTRIVSPRRVRVPCRWIIGRSLTVCAARVIAIGKQLAVYVLRLIACVAVLTKVEGPCVGPCC